MKVNTYFNTFVIFLELILFSVAWWLNYRSTDSINAGVNFRILIVFYWLF